MGDNRIMADLYEENQRLKARISELESKHFVECTQIAQYSDEDAKLKELQEENRVLMQECDRLIKEKGELLSKVSGGDVLRICQLEEQLEKAKRLLKSSTNVLNKFIPCDEDYCSECIKQRQNCDYDDSFKWLYAAEALALIGKGTNVPTNATDTNVGGKGGNDNA